MPKRLTVAQSIVAIALLTQGVTANADFITQTESFNLSIAPFGFDVNNDGTPPVSFTTTSPKNTDSGSALTFDKFNTGLGTLLGVTVTFQSTFGANATLSVTRSEIVDTPDNGFDFFADGLFGLSLTGAGLNQTLTGQTFGASCLDVLQNSSCSPGTPANASGAFDSAAPISLTPTSSFEGPGGTFVLTAALASAINPRTEPDNGTHSIDNSTMVGTATNTWSGSVSVQYEYERSGGSVPEPMTLYLLLAGAAGIGLLRRRK